MNESINYCVRFTSVTKILLESQSCRPLSNKRVQNPAPSIDYDSVINQSVSALQSSAGGIDQEGLFSIVSENPALIIGGALALVTLPAIPALLSGGSKGYGGNVTPRQAVEMMEAATKAVLVDVRSKAVVKAEGVPALKGTGATRLGVPIKVERKEEKKKRERGEEDGRGGERQKNSKKTKPCFSSCSF